MNSPGPPVAGFICTSCPNTSVVLLDTTIGVNSEADIRASFVLWIYAVQQVNSIKIFNNFTIRHPEIMF